MWVSAWPLFSKHHLFISCLLGLADLLISKLCAYHTIWDYFLASNPIFQLFFSTFWHVWLFSNRKFCMIRWKMNLMLPQFVKFKAHIFARHEVVVRAFVACHIWLWYIIGNYREVDIFIQLTLSTLKQDRKHSFSVEMSLFNENVTFPWKCLVYCTWKCHFSVEMSLFR